MALGRNRMSFADRVSDSSVGLNLLIISLGCTSQGHAAPFFFNIKVRVSCVIAALCQYKSRYLNSSCSSFRGFFQRSYDSAGGDEVQRVVFGPGEQRGRGIGTSTAA